MKYTSHLSKLALLLLATCVHAQSAQENEDNYFAMFKGRMGADGTFDPTSSDSTLDTWAQSMAQDQYQTATNTATTATNTTAMKNTLDTLSTTATNQLTKQTTMNNNLTTLITDQQATTAAINTQGGRVTSAISSAQTEINAEGDETQQALVTMIGRTNKLLQHYLSKTPEMIRLGIYGSKGLNASRMNSIAQTLPDPLAITVKTQQNMMALIDPFNPSARAAGAVSNSDAKVMSAYSGLKDLNFPSVMSAGNIYEYTTIMLTNLFYPLIKGGRSGDDIVDVDFYADKSERVVTKWIKVAEPENNVSRNFTGTHKQRIESALQNENFKKTAKLFIRLKNLQHRYKNCSENWQTKPSGSGTSVDTSSSSKPSYIFSNEDGLKNDKAKTRAKAECGPVTNNTTLTDAGIINSFKYANGFPAIIEDSDTWLEDLQITSPKEILKGGSNMESGFIDCNSSDGAKTLDGFQACKALNYNIANVIDIYRSSLSLNEKGSAYASALGSGSGANSSVSFDLLKTLKPHLSSMETALDSATGAAYTYAFYELELMLSGRKPPKSGDNKQADGSLGAFPGMSTYIDKKTYVADSSKGSLTMLECVDQTVAKPKTTQFATKDTSSAAGFIDSITGLQDPNSILISGLPVWDNFDDQGKKYMAVLAAGAFVPLSKPSTSSGNAEMDQYLYPIRTGSAQYYFAGKDAASTDKTGSTRPSIKTKYKSAAKGKLQSSAKSLITKVAAYTALQGPYDMRNTEYTYSCKSLNKNSGPAANKTLKMTPMQAMQLSSTWRMSSSAWRSSIATMDTNNLLREIAYLLAEMRQQQFESYLQDQRILIMTTANVAQSAASADAAAAFGGDDPKKDADDYTVGRESPSVPGGGNESADNQGAEGASSAADAASGATEGMSATPPPD